MPCCGSELFSFLSYCCHSSVSLQQNNIIAACAVVGLNIGEGKVIGKTWKIVLAVCTIATLVILAFFIRF